MGIASFLEQYYDKTDLELFCQMYGIKSTNVNTKTQKNFLFFVIKSHKK